MLLFAHSRLGSLCVCFFFASLPLQLQSDFVREEDAAALAVGSTAAPSSSSSSSSRGPVNVDVNLLTNLLRSHEGESAQGWTHAGPVSSIMGSMGMHLPAPDRDEKEQ